MNNLSGIIRKIKLRLVRTFCKIRSIRKADSINLLSLLKNLRILIGKFLVSRNSKFTIAKNKFTSVNKVFVILTIVSSVILVTFSVYKRIYAASTPYTWSFASSGDYIVSNSSLIEVISSQAKLKVREYITDGDTVGLFHLNETSGTAVADSSGNSNNGTIADSNWTNSGNLFNGSYDFDGVDDFIQIADSSSLSFDQSHTIEAWFKVEDTFTSGSAPTKMGIVDKGNYKVYLDNETGKLSYELAPSTATNWTQVAGGNTLGDAVTPGSWDLNGKIAVSAIVPGAGSDIYVGVGSPLGTANAAGDAEVWKWDGSAWSKIGGDGTGASPSVLGWDSSNYEEVTALVYDSGTLYAGISGSTGDAEVWSYNGSQWTRIGGDGTGWADVLYESVNALIYSNSYLYAALGTGAGDAEVWRWNGSSWLQIGGTTSGNWGTSGYDSAMSLASDATYLYSGLGVTAGEAEVWRWPHATASCTGNPCTWTKIGGDNLGWGSGGTSTIEIVQSMVSDGTNLYVGLALTTGDADVYKYDGANWSKIGGDAVGWADNIYEYVNALTWDGSNLYAGMGTGNNEADVFKYNGTSWSQVGGGTETAGNWNNNAYQRVRSLAYANDTLYVGTQLTIGSSSNYYGGGEFWTLNSGTWTRVGGNYVNNSWGYSGLNSVESMVQVGEYLYVGTGYSSSTINVADSLVFRYDGTSWVLIGGQGINSGWGGSGTLYETVQSMASYNGELYVGLGSGTGDAEIWKWNGTAWSFIGGDGTGWANTTYEYVYSMITFNGYLYAGLGNTSGQSDAEIYRYDGATWVRVGGDGTGVSPNRYGWATGSPGPYEAVMSVSVFEGTLYAGLGYSTNDAEVWKYNDNGTAANTVDDTWTKIGGDGTGVSPSSLGWATGGYAEVTALAAYKGDLYAGLGSVGGAAEVWKWDGTQWTKVGGDGTGDSPNSLGWMYDAPGPYERVRSLVVYNGELYASLGDTAGDSEVWRYDGTQWYKVAGDGTRDGWLAAVEYVNTMTVYKGKLYAGTGNTNNADAMVFALGNNSILQSTKSDWENIWYHLIASYDGTTMRLKVEDISGSNIVNESLTTSLFLTDMNTSLLIGSTQGEDKKRGGQGYFEGMIDEVRISDVYRSSYTSTPYSSDQQTVENSIGRWSDLDEGDLGKYSSFTTSESAGTGSITFRLSDDNGDTWYFWSDDSNSWEESDSVSQANSQSDVSSHIDDFPISDDGIKWQAILDGDGTSNVVLNSVTIAGVPDTQNPDPPDTLNALDVAGGSAPLDSMGWYPFESPYFSWEGAIDNGEAGIAGYFVYFGPTRSSVPSSAGHFQEGASFIASTTTPNVPFYLLIQTKDKAQNTSEVFEAFTYNFDNVVPSKPVDITVSPTGYASSNQFTFTWSAVTDLSGSTLAGYQYQAADEVDLNGWSETITDTSVVLPDIAYTIGTNYFHVTAIDNAGNRSDVLTKTFLYGGAGPSSPRMLVADPEYATVNSFSFRWRAPETFSGLESELKYCYSINVPPTPTNCTYTAAGVTSLSAGPYATLKDTNTLFVVAKNPESSGGAINYGSYATVNFEADTSAPGIPLNTEISDVSVKSTSSWKIAISWESPTDIGSGISNYQIWHSLDGVTYTEVASTTGIAYVDTGLTQATHYYKIRACDSVDNCGAFSAAMSLYPTGKFTDAPVLNADPVVSGITTKKASIAWSTDRSADSKISYGEGSDDYFDEEPSNSDQVTDHTISLSNLSPGTNYYFKSMWTDEDGNTGLSDEFSFETNPAPTVSGVKVKVLGITSVTLEFTTSGASTAKIYYGETSAFGGFKEISTSTEEATYNITIDGLKDGVKYFYKVNTLDSEGDEYEGTILDFTTLPLPRISDIRIQQVKGTAQPTVLITWTTNTDVSSIISYYPEGNPAGVKDEVNVTLSTGAHKMILRGLLTQTKYVLTVSGRDIAGNEAVSDAQRFTTATDTRPPLISELRIEGSSLVTVGTGESQSQLIVSWNTDELATSQVEFGEGTGSTYSQKTQEDSNLTFNHMVVVSGLTPSKVYHLRALSKDSGGNLTSSVDTVTITPKAAENALDLVITNLQGAFGFIGSVK